VGFTHGGATNELEIFLFREKLPGRYHQTSLKDVTHGLKIRGSLQNARGRGIDLSQLGWGVVKEKKVEITGTFKQKKNYSSRKHDNPNCAEG